MFEFCLEHEFDSNIREKGRILKSWALRAVKPEYTSMQFHVLNFKSRRWNEVDDFKHVANNCLKSKDKQKSERILSSCSVKVNSKKHNENDMLKQNIENVESIYRCCSNLLIIH